MLERFGLFYEIEWNDVAGRLSDSSSDWTFDYTEQATLDMATLYRAADGRLVVVYHEAPAADDTEESSTDVQG